MPAPFRFVFPPDFAPCCCCWFAFPNDDTKGGACVESDEAAVGGCDGSALRCALMLAAVLCGARIGGEAKGANDDDDDDGIYEAAE